MPDAARRPNILLVMADQLSALATSPYGNRDVLTPNLARLAARGVTFERAYCNSPLCAPSRSSMLAGQLAGRIPLNDNAEELPASVPTFVHHLRHGGYLTILSGKMHFVGPDQLHGFEERLTTDIYPSDFSWTGDWRVFADKLRGLDTPRSNSWMSGYRLRESGPVPWSLQLDYDEEVHFRALERLRALARRTGPAETQPWFCCVSYTHPHDPYVATPEHWARYEGLDIAMPEDPPAGYVPHPADVWVNAYHGIERAGLTREDVYRSRRGYYASTSYFDDKVGELLDTLERQGLADDTLVVVTSDHGDQCGEHGMWYKRTHRQWATRVPLIAAGPGVVQGRRIGENVSLVDLYPTLVELGGLRIPEGFPHQLDGHSLAPFLAGKRPQRWPNEAVVENFGSATIKPIRALVKGQYKFVYVHEQPDQLFDLASDPNEWRNVVDDPAYASLAAELRDELLSGWDPSECERQVLASQQRRAFLRAVLSQGKATPWDYQPIFDASRMYKRGSPVSPTASLTENGHLGESGIAAAQRRVG